MTTVLTWTQPAKDVVTASRLDADHFQPKYVALEKAIAKTGNAVPLGSLLTTAHRGMQPVYDAAGSVLVVNSQHVGEHWINVEATERTTVEFWKSRPRARTQKFDVLVNSTGLGTIGRVNCVLHDEATVVDNHVTVLRVKPGAVNPLYLSVFLNSHLGRQQAYKWQSGSSGQLELYPSEIRQFLVVVPDQAVQDAIADQMQQAYDDMRAASVAAAAAEKQATALAGY